MADNPLGRSRAVAGVGYRGRIPAATWDALETVWREPLHISSNYSRYHAIPLALAASMGWISNIDPRGRSYSRMWHITAEGIIALRHRGRTNDSHKRP